LQFVGRRGHAGVSHAGRSFRSAGQGPGSPACGSGLAAVVPSGANQRKPPKTPALKARIKQQLVWKHCRFLKARGRPDEWQSYFNQIDATTKLPPDEAFEAVDARMRAERWDDMRAWKRQNRVPCDGNDTAPEARSETASALLVRTGGWYHGKAAAPA
jgi:hypothetical protein